MRSPIFIPKPRSETHELFVSVPKETQIFLPAFGRVTWLCDHAGGMAISALKTRPVLRRESRVHGHDGHGGVSSLNRGSL